MTTVTASSVQAGTVAVLYDPDLPMCAHVSRRLGADLWSPASGPWPRSKRLVYVVDRPSKAAAVRDQVVRDQMRPALVVAWALAEEHVAALLDLKIPVVDGSLLTSEDTLRAALEALGGLWTSERFAQEGQLARELDNLERVVAIPDLGALAGQS